MRARKPTLRESATESLHRDSAAVTMNTALKALPLAAPVAVGPELPLRQAVIAADTVGGDVVVVIDPASRLPLGILTLRTALRAIVEDASLLDQPVAALMTGGLASLSAEATIHQATVLMFRKGMRHLLLTAADGSLFNVVSQGDLYGMQAADSARLANAILAAGSVDELAGRALAVRRFAARRLAEGTGAEALCESLSALNDLITLQAIELIEAQFDLPYVPWSWLVFGSEGRLEQTLVTDQDNGIVFVATGEAEAETLRQAFLPFARAVNEALHRCGFPLCKGDVMASNPAWCLSLDEWKRKFFGWIAVPEPPALLNATIFFDFRSLFGRDELSVSLHRWLRQQVAAHPAFLRALTEFALEQEPPLNWLRAFRFDSNPEYPKTIDLKSQGARLFVDAARVIALANGIEHSNTAERLRSARATLRLPVEEEAALVAAFYQIQRLRLQSQIGGVFPDAANRVDPKRLHELDRHILKEVFRQAGKLQQRLRVEYLPG
jgi:CBS domain-containing protein